MVDDTLDPRTVESMKKFSEYSDASNKNMVQLRDQMREFNKTMNLAHVRTKDLRESLRQMQNLEAVDGVSKTLQQSKDKQLPLQQEKVDSPAKREAAVSAMTQNVTIQTLKIDVSGVTDRSDKKALAKDISELVAKELRTKMGGAFKNSGVNRGV